jgi:hypothetical protein
MIDIQSLIPHQINPNCRQCYFIAGALIEPCTRCNITIFMSNIDCDTDCEEIVVIKKKKKFLTE